MVVLPHALKLGLLNAPSERHNAWVDARLVTRSRSRFTTPSLGDRDAISQPADIQLLKQSLAPGVLALHHAEPDYAHLDYEVGMNAPTRIYPKVIELAKVYAAGASTVSAAAAPPSTDATAAAV